MKIKNKLWILAIILLLSFIVNSCDGDKDNECPICKSVHCYTHCVVHDCENHNIIACDVCTLKCEHKGWAIDDDEAEVCGKYECVCGPTVYGYINGIPVYRMSTVTDEQMKTKDIADRVVFAKLEAAYEAMENEIDDKGTSPKSRVNTTNINAFHMTDAGNIYENNEKVVYMAFNVTNMTARLNSYARNYFVQLQQKQNAIRMAEAKETHNDRYSFCLVLLVTV